MPTPFLSSEEYDERAHKLYNEGDYDAALGVLREGLKLYPNAVELHIGLGYARLARDEYVWAKKTFEEALILDPDHEDALAGLGETLLKFGAHSSALKNFRRILELGYRDDVELMLQAGRALFREGLIEAAKEFFEIAVQQMPESAEGIACLGYAEHRMGRDEEAIATLRRALQVESDHAEARIYLGNILYDRGEYESSLYHLDQTSPEDHWDELGIWRLMELKKTVYRLQDDDPELKPWEARLGELASDADDIDDMLAEIEQKAIEDAQGEARHQLELFGSLLTDLASTKRGAELHRVVREGQEYIGTWDEIVSEMCTATARGNQQTIPEFMRSESLRGRALTGVQVPTGDAEAFVRGCADAGLLRIVL